MRGRPYTKDDMKGMKDALALLTAYDMGTKPNEFAEFVDLLIDSNRKTLESSTQLSWLLLRALESSVGVPREEILAWYGARFAETEVEG